MSALGRLVVELALSSSSFTAGIGKADQDTLRFAKSVQSSVDSAARASRDFLGSVVTGALGVAASYLTVSSVIGRVTQAIERLDATAKTAQRLGMPAEELEKLQYAARLADVSVEQLGTSTRRLADVLVKAAAGGTKEAELLKGLGIEAKNADGSVRGVGDVLGDVADLFASMPDGTTKTALAIKLLGEQGAALAPLLNGGRKALKEAGDEAVRFGLVSTDAARKAAEAFNDNATRLGAVAEAVFNRLAVQALPTLLATGEALLGVADGFSNTGDEADRLGNNRSAQEFLETIILGAVTTAEALVGVVQAVRMVGSSFGAVAADLGAAWAIVRSSPEDIGRAVRDGTGPLAAALAARNKTVMEANAQLQQLVSSNGAAVSQALRARFDQQGSSSGAGSAMTDALKRQAAAQEAARKAAERRVQAILAALNADTKGAKAAEQLNKATADYVGAVEHRLEVSADELTMGRARTDAEVALADLRDRLHKGTIRLTATEQLRVESMIRQTQANRDAGKATAEYLATLAAVAQHSSKMLDAEATATDQLRQQLVALRDRNEQLALGEEAYSLQTAATMRATAAEKEMQAARLGGNFALEEQARLLRALADEEDQAAIHRRNKAALEAHKSQVDDMQRISDQIGQGLANALMQGGKSAWEYIKGLFRTMVLQPILQSTVQPILNQIIALIGGGAVSGGAGGVNATQGTQALSTLYGWGKAGYGWLTGAGAAGSTGLAAGGGAAASIGGSSAGAVLADGTVAAAGSTSTAGGSAAAGMGWAGWAALIAVAVKYADSLYDKGFTGSSNVKGKGWYEYTTEAVNLKLFNAIGLSEKWAQILSGSVRLNHMFGRSAPRIEEQGVMGTLGGGDFGGGRLYADVLEKGGLFRSDKRYQEFAEMPEELGRMLSIAAGGVRDQAKLYGEALGLPVAHLDSITKDIKVALTEDSEANSKALLEALTGYGDALVAGYAEAIKPLANYGETTVQTIERVGTAIMGVNDVLSALGITALQATVDGGAAAVELQAMFGGISGLQQAASGYAQAFLTEGERIAILQGQLTAEFAKYGAQLPTTREEFRALVDQVTSGRNLETAAGRQQFAALMSVAGAFDSLITAQEGVASAATEAAEAMLDLQRSIADGLSSVIADFASSRDLAVFRATEVQATLAGGGINATIEAILGSSRADIMALWHAVGDEGKAAILAAYGAWQDMTAAIRAADIAAIVDPLGTTLDSLLSAYAELTPASEDLITSWRSTRAEVRALSDALAEIDGTQAVSALDALRNAIGQRDGLRNVIGGIDDRILGLRVGQGGSQAVDLLKQREAKLWAEFASTKNPAIAQAITDTTLQRIQLEGSLLNDANKTQIDALKAQISASERLRDIAKDMGDFVLSLKAGSLSNLSYTGRLSASRQLLDNAIATGGDVQGQAQSYLTQAQQVYGGSTGQYSAIFDEVTARLEGLGLGGGEAEIAANSAQAQLDALMAIGDTSDQQIAALGDLRAQFGVSLDGLGQVVRDLRGPLDEQLAELRLVQAAQERQIIQAGEGYMRLIEEQAAGRVTLERIERRQMLGVAASV